MSDNKEQNQQPDYFSRYMQQQLKDHRLPPDKSCWDEIEQRMKRKRLHLFIRSGLCVAGAAILALLLLMNIPVNKESNSHYNEIIEELANNEVKIDNTINSTVDSSVIIKNKPFHRPSSRIVAKAEIAEIIPDKEADKEEISIKHIIDKEPETEQDEPVVNQKKKEKELPVLSETRLSFPNKNMQKKSWQVGAGLIAMGNVTLNGENALYDYSSSPNDDSSWIPFPPNHLGSNLQPNDYDDINYNLPLSFGITVRKKLAKKLSVETGLVYTYLSTDMKKYGSTTAKGKLGLHYLGIPVNLIFDLWSNPKWNVYASTGIMVEKGLRSVYTQEIYRTNKQEKTTVKTSISGLQWSLNGSLGISYRVYKGWNLYAEPRISYFFDNNQPISIRTDKPISLGFGLGVRFDFH